MFGKGELFFVKGATVLAWSPRNLCDGYITKGVTFFLTKEEYLNGATATLIMSWSRKDGKFIVTSQKVCTKTPS